MPVLASRVQIPQPPGKNTMQNDVLGISCIPNYDNSWTFPERALSDFWIQDMQMEIYMEYK